MVVDADGESDGGDFLDFLQVVAEGEGGEDLFDFGGAEGFGDGGALGGVAFMKEHVLLDPGGEVVGGDGEGFGFFDGAAGFVDFGFGADDGGGVAIEVAGVGGEVFGDGICQDGDDGAGVDAGS